MPDRVFFFFKDVLNVLREIRLRFLEVFLPRQYYIQQNADFNTRLKYYPEFGQESRTYNRHEKYLSTRDGNRVLEARLLLDLARKCAGGDYAEIGTFRGNFARLIYRHKAEGSKLYCFDTFEGFATKDLVQEKSRATLTGVPGDFSRTSLTLVQRLIDAGPNAQDLVLRKGYFPDTYQGLENQRWRFVHLDVDLYEPSLNVLRVFWPSLVAGGILLIHDYNGHYRGVRKAVDEYFGPLGIHVVPVCDKVGSAVVIKNGP